MGSSGGGTPREPRQPTPSGTQVPYGQTAPVMPPQASYLPTDPGAMATGLTPEMLAGINSPPPLMQQQQAEASRAALAQQMAQQQQGYKPSPRVLGMMAMGVPIEFLMGPEERKQFMASPLTRGL